MVTVMDAYDQENVRAKNDSSIRANFYLIMD